MNYFDRFWLITLHYRVSSRVAYTAAMTFIASINALNNKNKTPLDVAWKERENCCERADMRTVDEAHDYETSQKIIKLLQAAGAKWFCEL